MNWRKGVKGDFLSEKKKRKEKKRKKGRSNLFMRNTGKCSGGERGVGGERMNGWIRGRGSEELT
jgi:hypothetical protein